MLRLSPEGHRRFVQAQRFDAVYGGGEANAAFLLAQLGADSVFVSKLPRHELGQAAVDHLRSVGVDTSHIIRGGDRIGIYFLEQGAGLRPSEVIYDRAGSAFALSAAEEYDWRRIFAGADLFHISGITPALGGELERASLEAVRTAKEMGLTVSCDVNYRAKLWDSERAGRAMSGLLRYADICIIGRGQERELFGITPNPQSDSDYEAYRPAAEELVKRFGLRLAAITLRTTVSSDRNRFAALVYDGHEHHITKEYDTETVDRIGGGDSFAAGLIYALGEGMDTAAAAEFAAAASALKLTVSGDSAYASVGEISSLAFGSGSSRVQR